MTKINEVCQFLDDFAPTQLAEDWDNVGLLVGDRDLSAKKIMTCLTVTPASVAEAIERKANLIVSHHPLPFHPLKRITTDKIPSKMLWDLIRAGISIYSPHTGFDSAACGINQTLAEKLELSQIKPLNPIELPAASSEEGTTDVVPIGSGRQGVFKIDMTLGQFVEKIKACFGMSGMHVVGQDETKICRIAIACGSGGSFLNKAKKLGCDTFVTGEATFHTCLEAESSNVSLVLLGHYTSERFALEMLAEKLGNQFTDCDVWASSKESDPLRWV